MEYGVKSHCQNVELWVTLVTFVVKYSRQKVEVTVVMYLTVVPPVTIYGQLLKNGKCMYTCRNSNV